jgi:hypothetical protein
MQRDIVIVPTFDRPEFLWLCLEHILAAEGNQEKEIWLCEDIHEDKPKSFTTQIDMLATIRHFEKQFPWFQYTAMVPHKKYGNSWNVTSALAKARAIGSPLTYIIEDDVLITKDFFTWHADCFYKGLTPWVSCAGRLNSSLNFESNGRYAMDETCKDVRALKAVVGAYISWATCFPWHSLDQAVKLFWNDFEYCPGVEQDMMIQNYMLQNQLSSIWPYVPRAYHLGWYSYHRIAGDNPYGTLEQKVDYLRRIVYDKNQLHFCSGAKEMDAFQEHEAAKALYWR